MECRTIVTAKYIDVAYTGTYTFYANAMLNCGQVAGDAISALSLCFPALGIS